MGGPYVNWRYVSAAVAPPSTAAPPPSQGDPRLVTAQVSFRPEVAGLRAVALSIVVVYHVWLGRVSGGVDVFLLVSAFLLTLSFASRHREGSGFALRAYWLRTFGRLLPPAAVVLLTTVIMSITVFPQVRWSLLIEHAWASLLYVQNWDMAFGAVDYQAADTSTASPFQHFWSLSVQGQVFILWPLILLACAFTARRLHCSFVRIALPAFIGIFALSLAFSIQHTASNQAFAYFDTRARLWEFALGSIVALSLPYLRLPRVPRLVAGWAGLAAIVLCGLLIQVGNQFPGFVALIPTVGAALVILAARTDSRVGVDRFLASTPVQDLGRISYALYLWHWPLLIAYLQVSGRSTVGVTEGATIIAVSLGLAWLTMHLVERPLQGWTWINRNKRRRMAFTVTVALTVAVPLSAWETRIGTQQAMLEAQPEALNPGARVLLPGWDEELPDALPIPAATDLGSEWGNAGATCEEAFLPSDPALESCQQVQGSDAPDKTVVVIGDSHALQLMPALVPIAEADDWRMITLLRNACRYGAASSERDDQCNARNEAARDYVLDLQPDVVISHGTLSYEEREPREALVPEYEAGISPFLEAGIEVVAVRDNPRFPFDMYECLERNGPESEICAPRRDDVLLGTDPLEELTTAPNFHPLDLTDLICRPDTCPAVIGNIYVYRDHDHLNRTYVETMAPEVQRRLLAALRN